MTFSRKSSSIKWPNELSDSTISRVETIVDLGFKFNICLISGPHIDMTCSKAYRMLGFIKRLTQDFILGLSLKTLYYALVRQFLEYGAVLWDPHTSCHTRRIEMVQRKSLSFTGFILHIEHAPHDYSPIAYELNIETLVNPGRWVAET
jgi:hypothetical protein